MWRILGLMRLLAVLALSLLVTGCASTKKADSPLAMAAAGRLVELGRGVSLVAT